MMNEQDQLDLTNDESYEVQMDGNYTVRPLKPMTLDEVALHNRTEDCWIIFGPEDRALVYDVTNYLDNHPGGHDMILQVAGQNATDWFDRVGHSHFARQLMRLFAIGIIVPEAVVEVDASQPSTESSDKLLLADGQREPIHFHQHAANRSFDLRRGDYLLFVTIPVFLVLFGGVFWQSRRSRMAQQRTKLDKAKAPMKSNGRR